MNLIVLLFEKFETLDVFGPVEIFGKLEKENAFNIFFVSLGGGIVTSSQQVPVFTSDLILARLRKDFIFMIPGGAGVRKEIEHEKTLQAVKELSANAKFVLSVCTGSALLAKAGVLDDKKATTNKLAYNWVVEQGAQVNWIKKARWVRDGNIYTSSGVSAGMDMALGFVSDHYGLEIAEDIASRIEYVWNKDSENDIFMAP